MKIVGGKDYIADVKRLIALYRKKGFAECSAYYYNPMEDVIFMKKTL